MPTSLDPPQAVLPKTRPRTGGNEARISTAVGGTGKKTPGGAGTSRPGHVPVELAPVKRGAESNRHASNHKKLDYVTSNYAALRLSQIYESYLKFSDQVSDVARGPVGSLVHLRLRSACEHVTGERCI